MKKTLASIVLLSCISATQAASKVDIDVDVFNIYDFDTVVEVNENCEFGGYSQDTDSTLLLAKCDGKYKELRVRNESNVISEFIVRTGVDMQEPIRAFQKTRIGVDFNKISTQIDHNAP